MGNIFFEITVVIILAAFLAITFRFLKQPSILAFIITGLVVGPLGPFGFTSLEVMRGLASIGITLLLFMIGLELNLRELRLVGKKAALIGVLQMLFTSVAAFMIAKLLGFSSLTSTYLGIALAFSSTILVIKLLSDKRDLKSLYGKIAVGVLLIQDLIAIFILIILSAFNSASGVSVSVADLAVVTLKVIVLFGWVIVLSREVLPKLLNFIARSSESLFLFSLAWVFGIAALCASPLIGFSIEIGGLLAGIALASSIESYQISSKVKPLRDFFLTIFFVTLGMEITFVNFSETFIPVVVFSSFILFATPIILLVVMGVLNYKKRTSFLTGLTLSQISEFSVIMVYLGNKIGHLSQEIVWVITFVGVITFVVSTYFIMYGNSLYKIFEPYLGIFEKKNPKEEKREKRLAGHTILIGANRMGDGILQALLSKKEQVVVVDFDPDIVDGLNKKGVTSFFGDITDPEIQEAAGLEDASLVISTVSDPEDTLLLLKGLKKLKKGPKVIAAAFEKIDARDFYEAGADYVIMPHIAGGNHLAKLLVDENHLRLIEDYRKKELPYIS